MVATTGSPLAAAHSSPIRISSRWKNVSRMRKSTPAALSNWICSFSRSRTCPAAPGPSRSKSCVRDTLPATRAASPATSFASRTAAALIASVCSPNPARPSFSRVPKNVSAWSTCAPAARNSRCSPRRASGFSMATSGVNWPLPLPVPTFSRSDPLST